MSINSRNKTYKLISLGPWLFKVRIAYSIITLLAVFILAYLGTWQLGRSHEKAAIIKKMENNVNDAPIKLSTIHDPHLVKNRFNPVIIYGVYLNKYTFLLDNQVFNGKVGYRVLTLMQSPYLEKWLLIDRGWIALGTSRQVLPSIRDIYGVQEVTGIINTIPTGIVLKHDQYDPVATWPIVIQSLDIEFMTQNVEHTIYDFVLQLRSNDPGAYAIPPIEFGVPSDKHFAYALQWYGFALLIVIYYFITSLKSKKQ